MRLRFDGNGERAISFGDETLQAAKWNEGEGMCKAECFCSHYPNASTRERPGADANCDEVDFVTL